MIRHRLAKEIANWQLLAVMAVAVMLGCQKKPEPIAYQIDDWRFAGESGYHITTEHYDLHTTLADRYLVDTFPAMMETAFGFYESLVPPVKTPDGLLDVNLFKTRREWSIFTSSSFRPERAKMLLRVRNGGYSEKGVTAIQYVTHGTTFPLLAHEGFHQYLHQYVGSRVPAWLNEGLAVSCEGQHWKGATQVEFDPYYIPQRRNLLARQLMRNELLPVERLLQIHAGDVIGGSHAQIGGYYAQVWMLVLFLRDGENDKYGEGFDKMLSHLGDEDVERFARAAFITSSQGTYNFGEYLFRAFITDDLDTFEKEYIAFMRQTVLNER